MKKAPNALSWMITLALPIFLGLANIWLLINPALPAWEYNRPNFPADPYGFTHEQRLEYAQMAIEFLASPERPEEAIQLLAEQTLDGEPLYTQRELDHLVDVKRLTDTIRRVAWVTGVIALGGTALLAWRPETRPAAWNGLFNGAVLTAVMLGAILLYLVVGWRSLFTRFHELLFPAGSWTFAYSETLIRITPEKFWFDVGVLMIVNPLVAATLIGLTAHWLRAHQKLN